MRCARCGGTGFYLGMGMMRQECDCDELVPRPVAIDRKSKAYKEAIQKLRDTQDLTYDEAVKVFDSEFQKIA